MTLTDYDALLPFSRASGGPSYRHESGKDKLFQIWNHVFSNELKQSRQNEEGQSGED